jgi:hypothetical protein
VHDVLGYRKPIHTPGTFHERQYEYDACCVNFVGKGRCSLPHDESEGYCQYKSDREICWRRTVRPQCTNSAYEVKAMVRHLWKRDKERVTARWPRAFRRLARRRWSAASPMPSDCMDIVLLACGGECAYQRNAW